MFQHQRVFNPETDAVEMLYEPNLADWAWLRVRPHVPLNQVVPLEVGETDFLGRETDPELAAKIAMGCVHPTLCVDWDLIDSAGGEKEFLRQHQEAPASSVSAPAPAPALEDPNEEVRLNLNPNFDNEDEISIREGGSPEAAGLKKRVATEPPCPPKPAIIEREDGKAPRVGSQQQQQVPVSFNQYRSNFIGGTFETMFRRRNRVGEVERDHEWSSENAAR